MLQSAELIKCTLRTSTYQSQPASKHSHTTSVPERFAPVNFACCFLFPVCATRAYISELPPTRTPIHSILSSLHCQFQAMAALASSASALFRGAALSVSAPAGSSRRARAGVRAEAEATTTTTSSPINPSIRKESDKVVDTVQVAELSKPLVAYCRCWRSETFPLCNGAHVKHNKETGDNVGPLLLKK